MLGRRAVLPLATASVLVALMWIRRRRRRVFVLDNIVRRCILNASPYTFPPRFDHSSVSSPVLLDANENSHGAPLDESALSRLGLERYPDPRQIQLKAKLSALRGCEPSQIFLGVGSDEVIDLLIRVVCRPGKDAVLVCSPTYAMYGIFARVNDVQVVDVPLSEGTFQLRVDAILQALTSRVKLIFLCSPGNPTGRLLNREDIKAVAEAATGALVVVDEAYIDFSVPQTGGCEVSCVDLVTSGHFSNVVISQTLSKAWGLAGARLGFAIASSQLVSYVDKLKAPFNVSSLTEHVASQAIDKAASVLQSVTTIVAERKRVAQELRGRAYAHAVFRVFPSDANFVLVLVEGAREICESLANRGVIVRYRGSMTHCRECIRVTIGTASENDRFLESLLDIIGSPTEAM